MDNVPKKNQSKSFSDFLFSFGCFIKQYTEWLDQADNLLCEILKTQKYKEILKRSYTANDHQVLLSVLRELSQKRSDDFRNKLNEYQKCKKQLQKEIHDSEKLALKDLSFKLNQKKKLLRKQYGIFRANKEFKKLRSTSSDDIEKFYNERISYWEKTKIDDVIEIRMLQIKKEMKECLAFYDYIFKKISKLDTKKQNVLFIEEQKRDFQSAAPKLPD